MGLVVELAVYDGVAEKLFVVLIESVDVLVDVELAEIDLEDDLLSLLVLLSVEVIVALVDSDVLFVTLPLTLLDWVADRDELDVVERESVAVVLTLPLNDMLAESEVDEVPLGVCETDSVGVTRNVNDGIVMSVVVLLGVMLLVALVDVLPVVEVLGGRESLSVPLEVGDAVSEMLLVALTEAVDELVDVVFVDTVTEVDWLSVPVSLGVLIVSLGKSNALFVALPLSDWEVDAVDEFETLMDIVIEVH